MENDDFSFHDDMRRFPSEFKSKRELNKKDSNFNIGNLIRASKLPPNDFLYNHLKNQNVFKAQVSFNAIMPDVCFTRSCHVRMMFFLESEVEIKPLLVDCEYDMEKKNLPRW
jgi:hypothetical protein